MRRRRYYGRTNGIIATALLFLFFYLIDIISKILNFIYTNSLEIILYILISTLIILIILILFNLKKIITGITTLIEKKTINNLKKNGALYSKIKELNDSTNFMILNPFQEEYEVYRYSDFANCQMKDYMIMTIDQRNRDITQYVNDYNDLLIKYYEYEKKYNDLINLISNEEAKKLHISEQRYTKLQHTIFQNNKIDKPDAFKIIIKVKYINRRGICKNYRLREYNIDDYCDLEREYQNIKERRKFYEINSRIERARMSESLRYDILKRDGFKCQICGATQLDGALLHVDHIIPVSKGGKTVRSNLQTLCSKCNRGKGNKID